MSERHAIKDTAAVARFVTAGKAIFTLQNEATGTRYTYKVTRAKGDAKDRPYFVAVLTGPNNMADYTYLGTLFTDGGPIADARYFHGKKSRLAPTTPSALGASWLFRQLAKGEVPAPAQVYHEGRCGKCGRLLTVPESIENGLGPICAAGGEDAGAPVPEFAGAA